MTPPTVRLSAEEARRVALWAQGLGGTPARNALAVARRLHALQIDPISVVANTQKLVVWSRSPGSDRTALDRMWKKKLIFPYWAHAASFVLIEDLAIHRVRQRETYPRATSWGRTVRGWMDVNRKLRRHIVGALDADGPLSTAEFQDLAVEPWRSTGWTNQRNVDRMLEFLWKMGEVVPVGRKGNQRLWHLFERWLPEDARRQSLSRAEAKLRAAQIAFDALGVATADHVKRHFTSGWHPELPDSIRRLHRSGAIVQVDVEVPGRGAWWLSRAAHERLDEILHSPLPERPVVLSPFDNLIRDRKRTLSLFGFDYRNEMYVPAADRIRGFYALPIVLRGEIAGSVDAARDSARGVMEVKRVVEDRPLGAGDRRRVAAVLHALSEWAGAGPLVAGAELPRPWRQAIRAGPMV